MRTIFFLVLLMPTIANASFIKCYEYNIAQCNVLPKRIAIELNQKLSLEEKSRLQQQLQDYCMQLAEEYARKCNLPPTEDESE